MLQAYLLVPTVKRLQAVVLITQSDFGILEQVSMLRLFKTAKVNVSQISFNPNGQFILSWGKGDSKILLWDVNTGEYKQIDDKKQGRIGVCFSPDGI